MTRRASRKTGSISVQPATLPANITSSTSSGASMPLRHNPPTATTVPRSKSDIHSPTHDRLGCSPSAYGISTSRDDSGQPVYRMHDVGIPDFTVESIPAMFDLTNSRLVNRLRQAEPDRLFLVCDPGWSLHHGETCRRYFQNTRIETIELKLPETENSELNKGVAQYADLIGRLMIHRPTSRDLLIAIGGGVALDIAGFAAATVRRGIPFWKIPSTLAAQIDAALSPKTAIDVGGFKNAAGVIYPPEAVLYDPAVLATVETDGMLTGMAELVKLAIVRSASLFQLLETCGTTLLQTRFQNPLGRHIIDLAIRLFLQMKFEAPYPGNKPASLRSFGHAFSRELESVNEFALTHGQAVSVEMAVASCLSYQAGILPREDLDRIFKLFTQLGLPVLCNCCDANTIWPVFERRFSRAENFYFPLPGTDIGAGTFSARFDRGQLARAIDMCRRYQFQQAAVA